MSKKSMSAIIAAVIAVFVLYGLLTGEKSRQIFTDEGTDIELKEVPAIREVQFSDERVQGYHGLENAVAANGKNGLYINIFPDRNVFEFGIAAVNSINGSGFFVDKNGNQMFDKVFEETSGFNACGLARVKENGRYGYIGTDGEYVAEPQFESAEDFCGGIAKVLVNGKYGIIDTAGEYIYAPEYDDIYCLYSEYGGPARIFIDGGCTLINEKGEQTARFDNVKSVSDFFNGYAYAVDEENRYGIIDKDGKIVVPIKNSRREGAEFAAKQKGIDMNEPEYDDHRQFLFAYEGENADVIRNSEGEPLYEGRTFYLIQSFRNGRFIWIDSKTYKIGITDEYGSFIAEPQYIPVQDKDEYGEWFIGMNYYVYSADNYIFCFGEKDNYLLDRDGNVVFEMNEVET